MPKKPKKPQGYKVLRRAGGKLLSLYARSGWTIEYTPGIYVGGHNDTGVFLFRRLADAQNFRGTQPYEIWGVRCKRRRRKDTAPSIRDSQWWGLWWRDNNAGVLVEPTPPGTYTASHVMLLEEVV